MAILTRSGDCNWCGQCCGGMDAPDPRSPFPRNWPSSIRNWLYADFDSMWKYASLVGVSEDADGTVIWDHHGSRLVPSVGTFYWMWHSTEGFGTDTGQVGDEADWIPTCPFLMPDDGTGGGIPHRECALHDRFYDEWLDVCGQQPPEQLEDYQVARWQALHPNCSYSWS